MSGYDDRCMMPFPSRTALIQRNTAGYVPFYVSTSPTILFVLRSSFLISPFSFFISPFPFLLLPSFILPQSLVRFADGAGLGDMGGRFPSEAPGTMDWKWATPGQPTPHTPAGGPPSAHGWRTWLGDVDAGLYLKLKGMDKSWNRGNGADDPSTAAWSNGGKGGVTFEVVAGGDQGGDDMSGTSSDNGNSNGSGSGSGSGTVRVTAFTSALTLHRGTSITFNVTILATPVKGDYQHTPEGKREHYKTFRHWHVPYGQWDPPSGSAIYAATGANTVILHQSNRFNPYIDWPFHPTVMPSLKEYVDEAKGATTQGTAAPGAAAQGDLVNTTTSTTRVKLYYTIGQISNHAVELFALAGLNGEVRQRGVKGRKRGEGEGEKCVCCVLCTVYCVLCVLCGRTVFAVYCVCCVCVCCVLCVLCMCVCMCICLCIRGF